MLAQLKTVVLIKEAIKLAFFRLVQYLEHQHLWVRLQAQNGQTEITFFWNFSVYSCSEKWRLFHERNCQETEDLVQRCVLLPSQNRANITCSTRSTVALVQGITCSTRSTVALVQGITCSMRSTGHSSPLMSPKHCSIQGTVSLSIALLPSLVCGSYSLLTTWPGHIAPYSRYIALLDQGT